VKLIHDPIATFPKKTDIYCLIKNSSAVSEASSPRKKLSKILPNGVKMEGYLLVAEEKIDQHGQAKS